MADTNRILDDAKGQLFDELDRIRAGMLGVDGTGQHMQPMTAYSDRDTGDLWFISSKETDLVRTLSPGATAHFTFTGKDHDYYACVRGTMEMSNDKAKLDELWSPIAAAWFEDGREDDNVCLLRFSIEDASVWATSGNPVRFAFQIAKANMTEETADLGEHRVLNWKTAA
ncbi:pyridoxamine 5'-phosphate oxidase family protein [Pelagovum pacificum]|uniref:General stress protein n=1 Tax=Pelagovum pacificum TaxID=2588711 RepID=A0A5C5G923_9RHOB|nr:pyridoxamine 5'-phosphate oxidase family protein [Pelagovum pacificum]QQA42130.1 pyridoxamine 5'-phosphate oxidase family protein [Pelagovum pacificum]TNY31218.1 general stress protein [Pelagovum pacificum]